MVKFRYKVVMINIILLSLGIGVVGFFMIRKNFQLALDTQIRTAIEENNLLQSAIEYRLLDVVNATPSKLISQMRDMSVDVAGKMGGNNDGIFVIYDGTEVVHSTRDKLLTCSDELWSTAVVGQKQYILERQQGGYYLFVSSTSLVQNKSMNIINARDITETYRIVEQQRQYFLLLLFVVVLGCTAAMFVAATLLTGPLEKLNQASEKFGQGDYESRVYIKSQDEVGTLAETYNQMADAVCEHMDELHGMVTRQEQFVADFTHEVKTPMTTIIGYADMLRSKELARENQVLAASYIFHEGKRLEAMSMKLFDYIYAKHRKIEYQSISVSHLMREVAESVTPILKRKKQKLVCEITDAWIKGDEQLLKSVFINIIDNARKASEDGSKIRFVAEKITEGVRILVQDFGVGISEEHLKRICDEFYMVDKSRSRQEGGAGLGLALAASIIESHGEKLEIESTVGYGTTMWVVFHEKNLSEQ